MKPRRTPQSNLVLELPGGNEDNSLWAERQEELLGVPETTIILTEWELTDVEREAVALGAQVELVVFGTGHPPVDMRVVLRGGRRSEVRHYVDPEQPRTGFVVLAPRMVERLGSWLETSVALLEENLAEAQTVGTPEQISGCEVALDEMRELLAAVKGAQDGV